MSQKIPVSFVVNLGEKVAQMDSGFRLFVSRVTTPKKSKHFSGTSLEKYYKLNFFNFSCIQFCGSSQKPARK
jgi:hypothetical protein